MKVMDLVKQWRDEAVQLRSVGMPALLEDLSQVRAKALLEAADALEAALREQAGEWEGREFIETPLGERAVSGRERLVGARCCCGSNTAALNNRRG